MQQNIIEPETSSNQPVISSSSQQVIAPEPADPVPIFVPDLESKESLDVKIPDLESKDLESKALEKRIELRKQLPIENKTLESSYIKEANIPG